MSCFLFVGHINFRPFTFHIVCVGVLVLSFFRNLVLMLDAKSHPQRTCKVQKVFCPHNDVRTLIERENSGLRFRNHAMWRDRVK